RSPARSPRSTPSVASPPAYVHDKSEPPVANPTRDRLGAQSLVEGLALGVVDLHLPLDPAVGAGFQLPEQFGGEPAAAELRANVEVVHPDAGLALPRGEVPAAEREAGDDLRPAVGVRQHDPGLRVVAEQVPGHLRPIELEIVSALVGRVLLDQRADFFDVGRFGVTYRHPRSFRKPCRHRPRWPAHALRPMTRGLSGRATA